MSDRVGACHKSQDVIKTEKERSFHMSWTHDSNH